jgi:hypothetical protein
MVSPSALFQQCSFSFAVQLQLRATGEVHRRGGAPRSESEIYVIAGGNHTTIPVFDARERGISASPMAASFRTFLAETRKVQLSPFAKINYNLSVQ